MFTTTLFLTSIFALAVPAHAALLDSQLDESAQSVRPPVNDLLYISSDGFYVAAGYVPPHDLSFSGLRLRVNTSSEGDHVCPTGDIIRYYGTSTPALWDTGSYSGAISAIAATPDANGNCDYRIMNAYGQIGPISVTAGNYYVFLLVAGGNMEKWVSMNGKPVSSSTEQSFFGFRPRTHNEYYWGTTGLATPYFEFFDTPPPFVITPPDPCVASHSCASNVLFLPGLEASRLYRPDYNGGTDKLWEPNNDSDAEDLLLTEDGKSMRNDVYTKEVIDEAYSVSLNIYKSFIAQMNELKTSGIVADWKAAPYDWRLSLDDILSNGNQLPDGRIYYAGDLAATSSPYIIQELRRLAKSSKTGKVTVIAHSNGGLLTKALTEKLGSEAPALIDKIIFVAVPQAGTPQAVGALLHGYEQGLPKDWLSVFLTPETARTLAKNMPSVYNLLPSARYFTQVDDPVVDFDDSDILAEFRARYGNSIHDGAQLRNFITDTRRIASSSPSNLLYPSVGNATLLSRSEALHTTLDTWTPPQGISLYEVAGWGEDTLSGIKYREGKQASCSSPWDILVCEIKPAIMYDPIEVIDGDGTVVVPSALWTPASTGVTKYWVDLKKYDSAIRVERKHADILEVPSLRTLIQNIFTNATSTSPLPFITTFSPPSDSTKRLRFLLHSPLDLSATDDLGNVVNSATSAIPGSRFKRYGEVQVLSVPLGTPLTLALNGYAAGSFTLDIQEIDGNNTITASTTFSGIPSTMSTKAEIVLADGTLQNASPLLLDYDGNSTTDLSLAPKIGEEVVFDLTPPEAVITFDPVSQEIVVVGTDNLSSTTVVTTTTSSLVTDEAGNTLEIIFKKFKREGKESKSEIQGLRYNGVFFGEAPKTVLQYEWFVDKVGKLKELQEKVETGSLTVKGHFDAKKDVTKIEEKTKSKKERDEKEDKKILSGLVIVGLKTDRGLIGITY